jgi:prolyl-tRNA synthetase
LGAEDTGYLKGLKLDDVSIWRSSMTEDLTIARETGICKKGHPSNRQFGPAILPRIPVWVARRDKEPRDKTSVAIADLSAYVVQTLAEMQDYYYQKALAFRIENTVKIMTKEEF